MLGFVPHPSLQHYDRGAKFAAYRQIAELEEYVLVDTDTRRVEVFRRQPGNEWLFHDYAYESACRFESVGLALEMARVFEDVEQPAQG